MLLLYLLHAIKDCRRAKWFRWGRQYICNFRKSWKI